MKTEAVVIPDGLDGLTAFLAGALIRKVRQSLDSPAIEIHIEGRDELRYVLVFTPQAMPININGALIMPSYGLHLQAARVLEE